MDYYAIPGTAGRTPVVVPNKTIPIEIQFVSHRINVTFLSGVSWILSSTSGLHPFVRRLLACEYRLGELGQYAYSKIFYRFYSGASMLEGTT